MNPRDKLKVALGKLIDSIMVLLVTLLLYQPVFDFCSDKVGGKLALPLTGTILAVISAALQTGLSILFNSGTIAKADVTWLVEGQEVEKVPYQKNSNPTMDYGQPLSKLNVSITCTPQRTFLFSLFKCIGMGLVIYDPSNNFGFTKSGSLDQVRYSVLHGKKVFIRSFYSARKGNQGSSWNISFDMQLLDLSAEACSLYCGVAFGSPFHKKIISSKIIQFTGNSIKIVVK